MDFNKLCQKVISVNSKIRFAGVINQNGTLVAGGMRNNIRSIGEKQDDESLYCQIVLRAKMRQRFDNVLGPVTFAMSYREKVIIMSFPVGENLLLISTESGIDLADLPFKVLHFIKY